LWKKRGKWPADQAIKRGSGRCGKQGRGLLRNRLCTSVRLARKRKELTGRGKREAEGLGNVVVALEKILRGKFSR